MSHLYQRIQEKIAAWRRTGYPVKGYPGLVFAPVLTILASLSEPSEVFYSQILPPCLYRRLEAICRLFFTQEGEKALAVVRGSRYNLVVTNTVKIRIQKRVRQHPTWTRLRFEQIVRPCLPIQPGVGRRVCSPRGPRLFQTYGDVTLPNGTQAWKDNACKSPRPGACRCSSGWAIGPGLRDRLSGPVRGAVQPGWMKCLAHRRKRSRPT